MDTARENHLAAVASEVHVRGNLADTVSQRHVAQIIEVCPA
jgi:hypothetical protein